MPLVLKQTILAAAIEAAAGTAETLANGDAAFNVFDSQIVPNIDMVDRPGQSAFSRLVSVPAGRAGTMTFKTELRESAAWADILFPAIGFFDTGTNNVWAPETAVSNWQTLTLGKWIGGKLFTLAGCMGSASISLKPGEPGMMEWTFQGVWQQPTDTALLTPTYPLGVPERFAGATFTLGGTARRVSEVNIDIGNNVIMLPDPAKAAAFLRAYITDRDITGSMDPDSELVASFDPHADLIAATERALVASWATNLAVNIPKLQITDSPIGDREGLSTDAITFRANRNAVGGDDELTITTAAAA